MAGKNIVLLSDGTGNSSAQLFRTNVWRLYQALDTTDAKKQVAYYDDGIGSSSFKLFAAITGIFGFGLKRNVIDIYSFCSRNYVKGDRIYGFGFSRGAFTMRVVAGLIAREGLVPYDGNEANLARFAADSYRNYRRRFNPTGGLVNFLRNRRDGVIRLWRRLWSMEPFDRSKQTEVENIHFLGLWDTVDAYGGPIEEITRAIDYWYWPLSMPDRFINAKVHRACHALALEDERDAFRPVIWDERYARRADGKLHAIDFGWQPQVSAEWEPKLKPIDRRRMSQVWFAGVHADVGGGYPQDGLSHVTIDWMIDRAEPYGLLLDALRKQELRSSFNPYDKLNDSRRGFAGYYRYKPRNLEEIYSAPPYKPSIRRDIEYMAGELIGNRSAQKDVVEELADGTPLVETPPPTIHRAVFDRIEAIAKLSPPPPFKVAADAYIPIVLPRRYRVTDKEGALSEDNYAGDPPNRIEQSIRVWNLVWWRRVVYFLTVLAAAFLVATPLLKPDFGADTPLILLRPVIAVIAAFVPGFLKPWLDAFSGAPGWLVLGGAALLLFLSIGTGLQVGIRDMMRSIWTQRPVAGPGVSDTIASVRMQSGYRIFFYSLKHSVLPTFFALLILWMVLALASQIAFRSADSSGVFCGNAVAATPGADGNSASFETRNMCTATQIKVLEEQTYRVTIAVTAPWIDRTIATNPQGFSWQKMSWSMVLAVPFRRIVFANWFAPVLRVGSAGGEEHVLDVRAEPPGQTTTYVAEFRPRSDGEVFVFVNDAVWGLPYVYGCLYGNNKGAASIKIQRLDPVR